MRFSAHSFRCLGLILAACLTSPLAGAEPPVALSDVASVEVLLVEADDRIEELEKLLASEESYDEGTELAIPSAAGVLACIGHGLTLHAKRPQDVNTTGLRDAAVELYEAGDLEEAKAALVLIKDVRNGGGEESEDDDDMSFGTLIGGYELMEEINTRTSKISRVARRPRGKPQEAAHAAVIALLCLPMHDQAEDYVEEEDVEDYQNLSLEYLNQLSQMSNAIIAKDGKTVKELLLASKQTCDQCHKKYRDGE